MASIAYDIDKQDFMRWLRERPEQTFRQGKTDECALSVYLSEQLGEQVTVTYGIGSFNNSFSALDKSPHQLPEWAGPINRMAHSLDDSDTEFTGAEILAKLEAADA